MNLFTIAWKSIRQRALSSSLTALSVALGVALMVTVLVINSVVTQMFSQSATGFDLVIGAKGSPMQLVLNTIYFMDRPIENLPYKEYLKYKKHKQVEHAIPFALGDSTDDGRFRIVGTIPEYFEIEYIPGKRFRFQSGHTLQQPFDAVVGARAAKGKSWKVGDTFSIAHGGNVNDVHAEKFTVAGILEPTGTPTDRAVFIDLNAFYLIPGHEKPLDEALEREQEFAKAAGKEVQDKVPAAHLKEGAGGGLSDDQKEVTAILLQMKSTIMAIMMKTKVNEGPYAQAVNPIEQISKLLRDIVGNVKTMLVVMTSLIIVVSGVSIFVSIYNSLSERRREIAVMRALGARRGSVFSIIVAESVLLCTGGGLLGLLLGHGLVFLASPIVEQRSDVLINPWAFDPMELVLLPALIVLAAIIGLGPGLSAYRTDVAKGLSD